jgi:predicted N-acyltransferase
VSQETPLSDNRARNIHVRLVNAVSAIAPQDWDRLANPDPDRFDPFVSWRFLNALEVSDSVGDGTGWHPHHLIAETAGQIQAIMPLYLKTHSQGEYVFDHGWADALHNAGGQYYPKLQAAIPFTPVTGRRFLVGANTSEQAPAEALIEALSAAAVKLAASHDLSSLHLTFLAEDQWNTLKKLGFLGRTDQQFHWYDRGYGNFEGFLASLASRKRKDLRKERAAAQQGLTIRRLTGEDIRPEHWDAFWDFYQDTGARKWGSPYLTRAFFDQIHAAMRQDVLLVLALDGTTPIAGALNFIGGEALYGRYWGRHPMAEDRPFLHFEVCYYQAIDFALEKGLIRVEAGAQGAHKVARGYEPALTRSAHWIAHPGLRQAVASYLEREGQAVAGDMDWLASRTPFRKG